MITINQIIGASFFTAINILISCFFITCLEEGDFVGAFALAVLLVGINGFILDLIEKHGESKYRFLR